MARLDRQPFALAHRLPTSANFESAFSVKPLQFASVAGCSAWCLEKARRGSGWPTCCQCIRGLGSVLEFHKSPLRFKAGLINEIVSPKVVQAIFHLIISIHRICQLLRFYLSFKESCQMPRSASQNSPTSPTCRIQSI